MAPKLLLIDGYAVAYRAYHATAHGRNILTTSKGEWTNAVYVFVNKLLKVWREEQPDYIAVALDRGKTFRHEQYPEYKANRVRMPTELRYQLDRIDQINQALNIPAIVCEGYEADDIIGSLTAQAQERGIDTIIMTGDTDILQLVNEHVQVLIPRGRYGDDTLYGPQELLERYDGLTSLQLRDLKALVGDPSDNIPGVRGIGGKTATALLNEYGSVEGIYEHLDEIKNSRARSALEAEREHVLLYKSLVTIRQDAPCELDLEHAQTANFDRAQVMELFRELEFNSLLDRIPEGQDSQQEGIAGSSPVELGVETQYAVVDTVDKLHGMLDVLQRAPVFAFDTETTSTDPMTADLVGISLAVSPGKAWYIPVGHGHSSRLAQQEAQATLRELPLFASEQPDEPLLPEEACTSEQGEAQLPLPLVANKIRPLFGNPDTAKYAHNATYDLAVLDQAAEIKTRGLAFDTMVAGWVIEPAHAGISLKAMTLDRLGIEMVPISDLIGTGKSQTTMDCISIAQVAPYACADADMTFRLVAQLTRELRERHQWELFTEIEMPLIPILTRMEMTGVRLDTAYLEQMSRELQEEQHTIEQQIYEAVGHEFNLNSTKQLSDVLFVELKLSKQGIRKTAHGYSTAADALALLQHKHPVVDLILRHRQISKLISTYVNALPALVNPRTGRLHTSYNQTGTITGRLSSSNPNLQNIPVRTEMGKQIRKGFVAEDGWVFLAADYSQIELRILAHVSQDPELLDAFHKDQDIHARTASAVYGVPIDAITSQQRRIAKTVNFGIIYGQSAYGLSQGTELDFDEAERFIATYFAKYPGVKTWLDNTRRQAYAQGYVETLLGRRRYFPELQSTQSALAGQRAAAERQAINAPIQGTAADILKIAMIRLDRQLAERGLQARMVLQVHDELVLEVPKAELAQVLPLTRDIMESSYPLCIPLKVGLEIGENWLEMEPVPTESESGESVHA